MKNLIIKNDPLEDNGNNNIIIYNASQVVTCSGFAGKRGR